MKRIRTIVIIVCLLLAQSALLAHELDISAHSGGEPCEYCALTGSLDKPVTEAAISFYDELIGIHGRLHFCSNVIALRTTYSARAPPFFS